jgi:hypothetical protein
MLLRRPADGESARHFTRYMIFTLVPLPHSTRTEGVLAVGPPRSGTGAKPGPRMPRDLQGFTVQVALHTVLLIQNGLPSPALEGVPSYKAATSSIADWPSSRMRASWTTTQNNRLD